MNAIRTRLHVEERLSEGAVIGLDHARSHYLRTVLRLGQGDAVALFNMGDGEWAARIEAMGKGWCSLLVGARRRSPQPEPDLWLVFAPIKRARIDFLAEKATELGVSVLQPVMTERTVVSRVNEERLAANAREAAEQCERLSVPEVRPACPLHQLLDGWPPERELLVCAESGDCQPLAEVLAARRDAPPRSAAIMTGPEGGYAKSELDAVRQLPFVTFVGLGPRVLRSDTAAIAALACWQAIVGDGASRPPFRS